MRNKRQWIVTERVHPIFTILFIIGSGILANSFVITTKPGVGIIIAGISIGLNYKWEYKENNKTNRTY